MYLSGDDARGQHEGVDATAVRDGGGVLIVGGGGDCNEGRSGGSVAVVLEDGGGYLSRELERCERGGVIAAAVRDVVDGRSFAGGGSGGGVTVVLEDGGGCLLGEHERCERGGVAAAADRDGGGVLLGGGVAAVKSLRLVWELLDDRGLVPTI